MQRISDISVSSFFISLSAVKSRLIRFSFSCISGFNLKDRKPIFKGTVRIDKMRKLKHTQITDPKTKVDSNNEKHVVSISLIRNQVFGNCNQIRRVFDRIRCVFRCEVVAYFFGCRCDQSVCEASCLFEIADVNRISLREIVIQDSHMFYSFIYVYISDKNRFHEIGGVMGLKHLVRQRVTDVFD